MTTLLEPKEGTQTQASEETLVRDLDCSLVTSTPASPSVTKIIDVSSGSDVKSTVMPSGSPSADGSTITLPALTALTAGREYRIHVTFTDGSSNTFLAIIRFRCPI